MHKHPRQSRWFHVPKPLLQPRLRLFCFPYAGGSAAVFHPWATKIPADVELCAIQLPGRGARMAEPCYTDMNTLLDDLFHEIKLFLNAPFAFFGYSLGTVISYEIARRLQSAHLPLPRHLIVGGRGAPHLPRKEPEIHQLPDDEFLAELRKMNGTPEEILANDEIMSLVKPIIRADFQLYEGWTHQASQPLRCPIVVMAGESEFGGRRDELQAWDELTAAGTTVQMFPGDHFFIHQSEASVLQFLQTYLV
jgi:medium-chain acyl-[acyl-carrier-protein] hydrolase